jgi:hypothetical protein
LIGEHFTLGGDSNWVPPRHWPYPLVAHKLTGPLHSTTRQ